MNKFGKEYQANKYKERNFIKLKDRWLKLKDEYLKKDWREIDDRYEISSDGVIYDNLRVKFRKGNKRPDGYTTIQINHKSKYIHRLVLDAFRGHPEGERKETNHLNGNRSDNRLENLEWCTRAENVQHAFDVLNKKSNLKGWVKKK